MTRIEALNVAIELFEDYLSGSPDAEEKFEEAQKVLINMRNNISKSHK